MNAKRRRRLLPLLIVIPVVLWGLLELAAAGSERARRGLCRSYLGNAISYGCHLYSGDYAGRDFPPDLSTLYPDFVSDGEVFLCPSAGKATRVEDDPHFSYDKAERDPKYRRAVFGNTHTDYVYVSGLRADDPLLYVLAFDDEWNHDGEGVLVLFLSAYKEWMHDINLLHGLLARQEEELAAKGRKMKLIRPAWSSWPDPPAGGHPLWGPRPWYKRRGGRAILVGLIAALVMALGLVVRTVRRGRKPGSDDAAQPER